MKHLYFCRHGETHANASGHWSGTFETPLTETGKQQAKLAGEHAKDLGIDYIICSPLGRARETAEIIAEEIGFPLENIEHNSLFIERHFGQMEGKPWEIDADVDGFLDVEARDSVLQRAQLAFEHIRTLDAENILIVSHGSFGRALRSLIHPHMPYVHEPSSPRFANAEIVKLI
jgi:broad specificity phosphatase PhoE